MGSPKDWEQDPYKDDRDLDRYEETGTFQDWLDANGIDDYYELVIDLEKADASNIRGQVFYSVEEALQWLFDLGLLSFSRVVETVDPETGDSQYQAEVGQSGAYNPVA